MADNVTTSQRTGYTITVTFTANGKTGTASAAPKQAGCPLSVDVYQVGYDGSTTPGGGIVGVGSYAYFVAKVSVPSGMTAQYIYWNPKNHSDRST